jgi:hypothetical protein
MAVREEAQFAGDQHRVQFAFLCHVRVCISRYYLNRTNTNIKNDQASNQNFLCKESLNRFEIEGKYCLHLCVKKLKEEENQTPMNLDAEFPCAFIRETSLSHFPSGRC